ncbi:S8 family peptidase [Sphingobacterium oryzagri]|uniref:S8 family peptidase n=1 Tax=Sphingobacterium oryzagri TaxID=3025669 RepID=A0ABY7WLA1_9SPHI|nr:S8 family peptidase [Sphingobacterium sp. KACC 22765]WDF69221.1 S8 family peptidase [Sphingobacterium sp. KACC 22765]
MPQFVRDHIILNERTAQLPYTAITTGRSKVNPRINLNRQAQGQKIQNEFNEAVGIFEVLAPESEFVYIVFKSAPGFLLDIDKFEDAKLNYRLASYKRISGEVAEDDVYEATVCLNPKAIAKFLKKVEEYINEDTRGGNPKHQNLIANLESIRSASLKSFWQEPELPFPEEDSLVWWEIWIYKNPLLDIDSQLEETYELLENSNIQLGQKKHLSFPEHLVILAYGSASQLGNSILYTDKLSELRKPKETADFFTYLEKHEQADWIEDLNGRIENFQFMGEVSVCLLDTGVNIAHPLLTDFVPEAHLDTVNPNWSKSDTHPQGHGTPMAGLILFGDLTDAFDGFQQFEIFHNFESVKIIEPNQPNIPELYGAITQEAIARAEIINPNFKRIICMAVTSEKVGHLGRPSSWSAAIDQQVFGNLEVRNENSLLFISSGNLPIDQRINTPLINDTCSIEDPAQSFNAITVGAYTLKDNLDLEQFPGAVLLAQRGAMAPCNTTSISWQQEWPRKPDIVMEGGNHGIFDEQLIDHDSLAVLSTSKGGLGRSWLTAFGDTSASTALASKFAAELYHSYSNYWPETIRALLVHSADWTPEMLGGHQISELTTRQKSNLIATVGYGVPNMTKARYSANNSLSLIIERSLKPYKLDNGTVKTNEYHLIDLPWPVEALQELLAIDVQLKVTLSYFVEPNPGNRQYELAASYRSHGLRFKMIDTNESEDAFAARVSKAARNEEYIAEGNDHWILGSQVRNKGSIHKDIWKGTAADLATRNKIAIYPVGGWWKNRKKLERYEQTIRYSLVVTIDTPDIDIDIYTPVSLQVPVIV